MSLPKSLTDQEYMIFSAYCKAMIHQNQRKRGNAGIIGLLLLNTGLRVGEAMQLTVLDVIIESSIVNSLRVRSEIAKNKQERIIPLNMEIRQELVMWFTRHFIHDKEISRQWLFYSPRTNSHITTRQAERIVCNIGVKSLGHHVNPHMLRHTFATRLLKVSNTRVVQLLLGHRSLQSTQIYTHPSTDELSKAVNNL